MFKRLAEKKWFIYALVPICALWWGLSYLGTSVTLGYLDVMQLLGLRWTVALLFFLVLMALRIVKIDFRGKPMWLVLPVGLLQPCIYAIFETLGIKYTTTSESSIFIATIPLMVLLIGIVVLRKKSSFKTVAAIIMAFGGVVVCVLFSPTFSLGGKGMGYLYLMGAVLTGALYTYASSRASSKFSAVEVTFCCAAMASVFFNCVSFAMGYGLSAYRICFSDMKVLGGVVFLGIFCSCLCYLIFNYVLGHLPTAVGTNLVANSTTAVGVISGCVFAGDPFGWYTVVGVAMTIAGVCLASVGDKTEAGSETDAAVSEPADCAK